MFFFSAFFCCCRFWDKKLKFQLTLNLNVIYTSKKKEERGNLLEKKRKEWWNTSQIPFPHVHINLNFSQDLYTSKVSHFTIRTRKEKKSSQFRSPQIARRNGSSGGSTHSDLERVRLSNVQVLGCAYSLAHFATRMHDSSRLKTRRQKTKFESLNLLLIYCIQFMVSLL